MSKEVSYPKYLDIAKHGITIAKHVVSFDYHFAWRLVKYKGKIYTVYWGGTIAQPFLVVYTGRKEYDKNAKKYKRTEYYHFMWCEDIDDKKWEEKIKWLQ